MIEVASLAGGVPIGAGLAGVRLEGRSKVPADPPIAPIPDHDRPARSRRIFRSDDNSLDSPGTRG